MTDSGFKARTVEISVDAIHFFQTRFLGLLQWTECAYKMNKDNGPVQ